MRRDQAGIDETTLGIEFRRPTRKRALVSMCLSINDNIPHVFTEAPSRFVNFAGGCRQQYEITFYSSFLTHWITRNALGNDFS